MRSKTKYLKTLVSLVLLMIAVLSFVNVSYSYFTSTISTNGNFVMGDLNVWFLYKQPGVLGSTIQKTKSITLVPETPLIDRGVPFKLRLVRTVNNTTQYNDIESLSILNQEGSCSCYVRFWIEAYRIVDEVPDLSVDYGKYFAFDWKEKLPQDNNFIRSEKAPYYYFIMKSITSAVPDNSLLLGYLDNNSSPVVRLILQDSVAGPVPIDLLGEKIQIRVSFEAIQAENKAYLSWKVDNDPNKEYVYSGWK